MWGGLGDGSFLKALIVLSDFPKNAYVMLCRRYKSMKDDKPRSIQSSGKQLKTHCMKANKAFSWTLKNLPQSMKLLWSCRKTKDF